jgi:hypothetical protein
LGLSPSALKEYTYNDILEDAYRRRERADSKILAWMISQTVGNLFAEKPKSLGELFPDPKPKRPIDIETRKQAFAKHKMILLE